MSSVNENTCTEQSRRVPDGWVGTTLGEQELNVLNGYAFKSKNFSTSKANDSYLPVLKIKNVANGDANHNDVVFHLVNKKTEKYIIRKNDILIALTGNHPFAKTQIVGGISKYNLTVDSLLNQRVAKLEAGNKELLFDKFIYYYFKWNETQFYIGNQSSGSASQANISKNDILNIPINLPPLPEQKSIAAILTAFDDKIELLQAQNNTLEQTAQTIFKEWFGKYQVGDELPEGWSVGKIEEIIERFPISYRCTKSDIVEKGKTPIFDQGKDGLYGYTDRKPDFQASKENPVVLFTNHTCNYWYVDYPFCAIQNVLPYRGKNGYETSFIYFLTKGSVNFIEYKGHWPNLASKDFIFPTTELAKQFSDIADSILDKISENNTQIQTLKQTRDTLLPKLMSGQVRVNEFKNKV